MYISRRSAKVRNALVSAINGSITLVILLIAPLGMVAVIINTILITLATYMVSNLADRVILWLEPAQRVELMPPGEGEQSSGRRSSLQRWWH
jgi:hypothetical protein